MPRQERPLDAGDSVVLCFARELRALRDGVGKPTYRELSARAHYSETALSQAAAGRKLPSLPVTLAYVRACGGSEQEWERRWHAAVAASAPPPGAGDQAEAPYMGLVPFQTEDAERFFGRERLTDQLAELVAARRVVVVVGASGAGKSSLLRAGLAARLGDRAVLFTPGAHPVEECVIRLARHTGAPVPVTSGDDDRTLHRAVRLAAVDGAELVLVIDQFEEIFTLCGDPAERRRFVDQLVTAALAEGSACRVVVGVRADFYGHCTAYPALVEAMGCGQVTVGPMTTAELRAAIVQPAARTGHTVETALVSELVADVVDQAGVLPLLSHVLLETWRRRRGNALTLDGFHAAGGIEGALTRTAESAFARFSPRQQEIARSLFLRLTALGEGSEDTKRRIRRDELDDGPDTTAVLDELTGCRLVTLDRDRVEISHEALIRRWPRLREWLAADRDGLRAYRQLSEAATTWLSLDRDRGALFRGARLEPVRHWLDRPPPHPLAARERDFLATSLAEEAAEITAARRGRRRLRQLVALLTVLLVFVAGITAVAVRTGAEATRERNTALSENVARAAEELHAADPALAAQLALAAYRLAPTPDARGAVLGSFTPGYATRLTGHRDNVNAVAHSPARQLLATASRDRTAKLVDVRDPHHPRERFTLTGHAANVAGLAFTSDGSVLATASWDRTARLWDTGTGALIAVVPGHDDVVNAVAFSPDDRLLATASTDRTVRLWDVIDPRHPRPLPTPAVHGDAVTSLAFGPAGTTLATASWDGLVHLWDVSDPSTPRDRTLGAHTGAVHVVAFSPDGRRVASGGHDRTVRLWPVDPAERPRVLTGHTDAVRAVAFSQDGRRVASGGVDHVVRLWDLADPAAATALRGHTAPAVSAVFVGDRTLATASDDHTVRLWDLPGTVLSGHGDSVYGVAVARSGRLAATAGYDRTVRVWDLATGTALAVLRGPADAVNSVAFSPDGRLLVAASADHLAHRWDLTEPRHPRPLPPLAGHTDAVNSVAISPDGRLVATGSTDHTIRLWQADDGTPLGILDGHTDSVESVAISPSGHLLASASTDFTARVWDLRRRVTTSTMVGHTHAVKSVAFSPDRRTLATGSADHTARLWDLSTGTESARLTGHTDTVHAVAFSPHGRTLVTAGADHDVRLWPLAEHAPPAVLAGHTDRVYALAFTPDGHTLLTAGGDHTTRLWEADDHHAAARICATVSPPLSQEDWHQYLPGLAYAPVCGSPG